MSRAERYPPRKYRVRTIATAPAAAAPANPDVSKPVQLSGFSATAGPVNSAIPARIVIKTPESSPAQCAEGTRWALVAAGAALVQGDEPGFIVRAGRGRYSGGLRGLWEDCNVGSNGSAADLCAGGVDVRIGVLDGG